MISLGRELTLSSHPWPLPWGSPRGRVVGLRPLAGEGESRRPLGVSNPGSHADGSVSIVVQASRLHIPRFVADVRPRRPHHNGL